MAAGEANAAGAAGATMVVVQEPVPAEEPSVTVSPEEFADIIERLVAAGLVKRTRLVGQDNIALTKQGRAMITLVAARRSGKN